jgi:hypothetical protein
MRTRYKGFALTLLAGVMLVVSSAAAQHSPTAKQLVGTWTMVSNTLEQDEKKTDFFGPNPKGYTIFNSDGHFARVVTRSDLPKFISNNRQRGTSEENSAVVQGSIAYFGTYTCNTADKGCTFHLEGSTFPNWVGATQKRLLTLAGEELRETVPTPSVGSGKVLIVWKRVH